MIKNVFGAVSGVLGAGGAIILYIGLGLGWLYWTYIGAKLGSFGMVIFGILGPFGFIASILGAWSLMFGIPLWLLHLVR